MNAASTRVAEPDQACADAVDLARQAAEQDAGAGQVGEHVGIEVEADRVLTHLFICLDPAYVGWRWAVTVSRASRSKVVTVSECLLLPGPDSLLAPDWVPWTERVRPGDLKAGDLMPASSDDERLRVPIVAVAGDAGLFDCSGRRGRAETMSTSQTRLSGGSRKRRGRAGSCQRSAATRPPSAGTRAITAPGRRWRTLPRPLRHVRLHGQAELARSAGSSASAPTSSRPTTARSSRSIMAAERTRTETCCPATAAR